MKMNDKIPKPTPLIYYFWGLLSLLFYWIVYRYVSAIQWWLAEKHVPGCTEDPNDSGCN
jgi:hypothetical protein